MAESKEVKIIINAEDNASKKLDGLGASFEKHRKQIGVAMTAVGGAITAGIGVSIKAAQENETIQKQLEHAVISVSKGTMEQVKAINDVTQALETKGVVDADSLKLGVAQLSTFGLTTKMVQDLTPALADLTINQAGVNASAEDYEASANVMAKALNGQFGVLEKSGIRFTDAQKQMIQFGSESERSSALIEGFNQNLKLTNDTARETSEGQMKALEIQMSNISESIGASLIPVLNQVVNAIQPIVAAINEWAAANPELFNKIVIIVGIIGALMLVLGPLLLILPGIVTAIGILGGVFGALSLPVLAIIVAIAAFIAILILLWKYHEEIGAFIMDLWQRISDWVIGVMTSLKDWLSNTWLEINTAITEALTILSETWNLAWTAISDFFMNKWNAIKEFFTGIFTWFKDIFGQISKVIGDVWTKVWDGVKNTVTTVFESIKGVIKGAINWIIDKINFFIEKANAVAAIGNKVPGVNIPMIPTIPKLEKGGLVDKTGLAMVHKGEVFSGTKNEMGFGNSPVININIDRPQVNDERQLKRLADEIDQRIMRLVKSNIIVPVR